MPNRSLRQKRPGYEPRIDASWFFRHIADMVPQMVWAARPDGWLDYFNARVFAYTGRSTSQLEGWRWKSVIHPEDWNRCLERWSASLQSGEPYEIEYRLRRHDGKYLWHLGAALPMLERDRVARWFGTCTDIEGQKRTERLLEQARQALEALVAARTQALEESERRLRAFLDSMPAIAWIKDSHLRYVWVSESYARVHGRALEEICGKDDFEVWPAELAQKFRRDDKKTLRARGPVPSFDDVPLADGAPRRWHVIKFPLPDGTGALGVAGIGFDVTARDGHDLAVPPDQAREPLAPLSGRERQVLSLIVEGHTSAEVALRLEISPKSVETYRSRLMAKLGIEDLPSLVKFAIRNGITGG